MPQVTHNQITNAFCQLNKEGFAYSVISDVLDDAITITMKEQTAEERVYAGGTMFAQQKYAARQRFDAIIAEELNKAKPQSEQVSSESDLLTYIRNKNKQSNS
ncbi:MAG: hypothetical protein WCT77_07130 [Bacteroidota bacterium]|jgi:hypothetical protein